MSLHLTGYVDMVDVNTVIERLDPTLLDRLGDVWLMESSRGGRRLGYVTTRGRRDVTLCSILPFGASLSISGRHPIATRRGAAFCGTRSMD